MALSCLIIWFCRVTRGKIEPAMRQPLSIKRKCQGGGNGEGVAHMGIGKVMCLRLFLFDDAPHHTVQ